MNVLLVEPTAGGHRLNIAGLLLDALARLPGVAVTFDTAPDAPASPQFRDWIAPRLAGVTLRTTMPVQRVLFERGWVGRVIDAIARSAIEANADHVLIPTGDGTFQLAAQRRLLGRFKRRPGVEFEAMMLRGKFAYDRTPTLRDRAEHAAWFAAMAATPFDRIHHMDPVIFDAAVARAPRLTRKLRRIPDPVDPIEADLTVEQARAKLGLPTDGRMLGCVGGLQLRKGIDLLIRSFARNVAAGRLRDDDRLLLVGVPEQGVDAILDGEAKPLVDAGRIVAVRRFVDDVAMSNALSAMNLVVTAYPGHVGSASITLRAAAQRRPVLADKFGWCGAIVPRFELGTVVDVLDAGAFDRGMVEALDASVGYVPGRRSEQLVRYGAVANFQAHWMGRLRERLGLPPEPKVTWAEATA
jgi:glycosyltransferase involved in cell wall biosynthesis